MEILKTSFTGINQIFIREEQIKTSITTASIDYSDGKVSNSLVTRIPDWKTQEATQSSQHIYIKHYSSSPLFLKISYYSTMKLQSNKGFNDFLKRFGLALNTIEGAPIKINALELNEVVGNINDIIYILKDRYMVRLKRNLFSILGASSLIGNPIQLVNNVSTGVKDFFYKPIEGFVEGPIEGGKGLVKGTGSLFKHTVHGTFGSTSSIFSSLSKGVLVIANDKDYMKERETNSHKERPENVIEGLGYGIKSAANSVKSGVTGLVNMPVKGAKDKGFKGFITGTLKGVTGLVAKPVSGAMDFISKTSEGIKNHAKTNEDKNLCSDRIRLPRVFYTRERVYKTFDELHAYSVNYLIKHKKMTDSDGFVDSLVVWKDPIQILVL
jgi:vacuolar protein sorting-associated protein 13A/C